MLLDMQNLFSNAQRVVATSYSQNVIYFGKGDVSYLPLVIQVVEEFAGLTSLTVEIETSDTEAFTTSTVLQSSYLPLAKLTLGKRIPIINLPRGNAGYIRIKYNVVGTSTAGKITAGVVASDELSYQDL